MGNVEKDEENCEVLILNHTPDDHFVLFVLPDLGSITLRHNDQPSYITNNK